MIAHLFVSTVVLAAVLVAVRLLPLTARTRYALLFCGLAKLFVPTAVIPLLPAEAVPQPLRILGGGGGGAAPVASAGIDWLPLVWGGVAAVVLFRWLLLRRRTIAAALQACSAPSDRELASLREARLALRLPVAVDLVRSPICEAPAVLRVIRPVIALPSQGCDHLDDDELRSLLLHECAHVARHDNLATVLQALATSLLWFHPLVWMASRALTIAREEACDEAVADVMHQHDAYLSALDKLCHAIVARPAGASCMANAHLKERIGHLMSYTNIRNRSWSHRGIVAAGLLLIALSTFAGTPQQTSEPASQPAESRYTGEKISLSLKDADLRGLMDTFEQITGIDITVAEGIEAKVTIEVVDMPWDQAFDQILAQHGLKAVINGKTISVTR